MNTTPIIEKIVTTINFSFFIKIALIFCLFFAFLFYFENELIFVGTKHSNNYRESHINNLYKMNFKQEIFKFDNLNIEFFTNNKNANKNLLFLGGNAEDVLFDLKELNNLFPEYNIYSLNYFGYGESQGLSNENKITSLIKAFSKEKLQDKPLIVFGRSLGTGFATKITSTNTNVEKLILVSPYYSMENVARGHYPFVPKILTEIFMENKINTFSYANKIKIPALIVYAKNDNVIGNKETEDLLPYIENKNVFMFSNEDHNSLLFSPQTKTEITNFISPKKTL